VVDEACEVWLDNDMTTATTTALNTLVFDTQVPSLTPRNPALIEVSIADDSSRREVNPC
jgi:hypothetical protein